jgi:hypothetical protein
MGQTSTAGPFHTERGVVPHRLGDTGVARAKRAPGATDRGDERRPAGYDNVVPGARVPQVVDPESPAATNEDTPVRVVMAKTALITAVYAGAPRFSASAQPP